MPGGGFTVTLMLSGTMLSAVAPTRVVQGVGVVPPYDTMASTLTRPAGIVTGDVAATHPGLSAATVTATPPGGAAIWLPPLSSRIVIGAALKLSFTVTDVCTMFRFAVVVAVVCVPT